MNRLYLSPLLLAVTTAWACVPDGDGETEKSADIVAKGEAAPGDCLLLVWSSQKERNPQFDRDHDFVEGGAISHVRQGFSRIGDPDQDVQLFTQVTRSSQEGSN